MNVSQLPGCQGGELGSRSSLNVNNEESYEKQG